MRGAWVEVFEKLACEQAEGLAGLLGEGILYEFPPLDAVRKVVGPSLSDNELYELVSLYASFMTMPRDTAWSEAADRTGLAADKRKLYAAIAEKMNGKIAADRVQECLMLGTVMTYGHPHIHGVRIFTEFRPVSGKNGIVHLVPYLVVDGTVHDPAEGTDKQFKIQIKPNAAKMLADNITASLGIMTAQIAEMREKFGDGVVHA